MHLAQLEGLEVNYLFAADEKFDDFSAVPLRSSSDIRASTHRNLRDNDSAWL